MHAIIPAKATSTRCPGKNLRTFAGLPLVAHGVRRLRDSGAFCEITVSTDSPAIAKAAAELGARIHWRAPYYCDETVCDANIMTRHVVSEVAGDGDVPVAWCHCTNPLISPQTYGRASRRWEECWLAGTHDSLVSVYRIMGHLWSAAGRPLTFDPHASCWPFARECAPVYAQDGGIFIRRAGDWVRDPSFVGRRPLQLVIPEDEVCDIDTEDDWRQAVLRQAGLSGHGGWEE